MWTYLGTDLGHSRDTNNNDNNDNNNILYQSLLNKYKERTHAIVNTVKKIHILNQMQLEEDYLKLSPKEQNDLFIELM